MRINIVINDETIRADVIDAIEELLEDGEIYFPSEEKKAEFTDDAVENVIDLYEYYTDYLPNTNYRNEVLDLAESYGYLVAE